MYSLHLLVLVLATQAAVVIQGQDSQPLDPCHNFVCQNGGSCTAPADAPYCMCPFGFTGGSCEYQMISSRSCEPSPCVNGGKCFIAHSLHCLCPSGFEGLYCEIKVKPGQCSYGNGSSNVNMTACSLDCKSDYDCPDKQKCCSTLCGGAICSSDIIKDPCNDLCLNEGICTDLSINQVCDCQNGFTGDRCEIHPGECPSVEPGDMGVCGGEQCSADDNCTSDQKCCPSACGGTFCTSAVVSHNLCETFECYNGGRCIFPLDYAICQCPSGFGGERCELIVKPGLCPYRNDSSDTCVTECVNDYECPDEQKCCPTACTGALCVSDIIEDPCDGVCLNGGLCTNTSDSLTCYCQIGFSGKRCEFIHHPGGCPSIEPDEMGLCGGIPCSTDYNCTIDQKCCTSACGVDLCATAIELSRDPCKNFACQNGGSCTAPADAPYCLCPYGYTGNRCEEPIYRRNPCEYYTCENGGRCTSPLDYAVCQCPSGFGGDHCEMRVKPGLCPSKNESSEVGACVIACNNDYNCTDEKKCCSNACGGRLCTSDIRKNPCDEFCLNGGFCSLLFDDPPSCECLDGFSGEMCETAVHPGECPSIESDEMGLCRGISCSTDDNCNSDQKCCPSACGDGICVVAIQLSRDPCKNFACQNGGSCTAPADAPYCLCPYGYTGNQCEEPIYRRNPCEYYTCENGGRCTSPLDYAVCQCPSGFGGDRCEMRVKPGLCPSKNESSEVGACVIACNNDYNCTDEEKCCSNACGGRLCTSDIRKNPCDEFCLNGGFCSLLFDDPPSCECLDGFSGEMCETAVHPGECPSIESDKVGLCGGILCSTDDNCTSDQKCCPSACGSEMCIMAIPIPEPPRLTCANMLCPFGKFCRLVAPCAMCQIEGRCIPKEQVVSGIDNECQQHNYSQVIFMQDPNNSTSYMPMACDGTLNKETCPLDSVCVGDQLENGSCCSGKMNPQPPKQKPGFCPTGDDFICGGTLCKNDSDCPGAQKCCPGCGSMCTDPVAELCGSSLCPSGQICVQKQRQCAPGMMCIQALTPTCVPEECAKCEYNEDCNKTSSGYECIPYEQPDLCGGCENDTVCIDTGLRCIMAPCPTYKCVENNACGGCSPGDVCINTGIVCVKAPCPTFQCVADNECGGCPNGQVCKGIETDCTNSSCQSFQCVPADECGGCPNGQVCLNTGIVCKNEPCPTFQCVADNECGGCPDGQVCLNTGIVCVKAPCPTFQCVADNECGGCPDGQVCLNTGIVCVKAPCPTFQCVADNECGGCPDGQVCLNTGIVCVKAPCPTFQCVADNECGGCPNGQVCKGTGTNCTDSSCQSFQCVPDDECGGCPNGQVCKDTGLRCITTPCDSFKCAPEDEPACPLRCPANYQCQLRQSECPKNSKIKCRTTLSPDCVRIKPDLGKCSRVTRRLPSDCILCVFENGFPKCQSDNDCTGTDERCCSSACGNKLCRTVK